jgi:hypothetical protein
MSIPLDKLKRRLLRNAEVKREYDALAAEYEVTAENLLEELREEIALQPADRLQKQRR